MGMVNGEVEAISRKFGKFGVLVGGKWYNTKEEWAPTPEPSKGDVISFDDGGKNYLKNCKIGSVAIGATPPSTGSPTVESSLPPHYQLTKGYATKVQEFPIPPLHPDRAICRQNALTNAVNFLSPAGDVGVDKVLEIAMKFEEYTTGDELVKAAADASKELGLD